MMFLQHLVGAVILFWGSWYGGYRDAGGSLRSIGRWYLLALLIGTVLIVA